MDIIKGVGAEIYESYVQKWSILFEQVWPI